MYEAPTGKSLLTMLGKRPTQERVAGVLLPLAVLGLYYWGLYVNPVHSQMDSTAVEKSREMLANSRTLLREGKYEDALAVTRQLYDAYPENHIYIEQIAGILGRLNRFEEESQFWEKFFEHSPRPIDACPQLGESYRKQGKLEETIKACERCLELDPKNPDSVFFLARAYELSGRIDRAKELYEQGVAISPGYPDITLGLARAYLRKGKPSKARELADTVLRTTPDNVDALLVMGMALRSEGKFSDAKGFLEQGLTLSEKYVDFYIVLGGISEQEGDNAEAIRRYDKVLELEPTNGNIAARRSRLLSPTGGQ